MAALQQSELRRQQTAVKSECGFEFSVEPLPPAPVAMPPNTREVSELISSDGEKEKEPMARSEAADPPGIERQISDTMASLTERLSQRFGMSLSLFEKLTTSSVAPRGRF